jgi:hypothetical protein
LHTNTACSKLVNLFQNTLDLENDLIYLRRVFFMEAGDLLSEFYTQLFTKLAENPEECNTLSLSVILHDCLCRRYPTEEIEKFTLHLDISEKGPLLETVALSYSVKWPLNIVLHSKVPSMSFYPDFILILPRFYPNFIQILSKFCTDFIQILSKFYTYFILIFEKIWIKSG